MAAKQLHALLAQPAFVHTCIDGMMNRRVVEYRHIRTSIALQGDLLDKFEDTVGFDRRSRDTVRQCVGREVEDTEHRTPSVEAGSTQSGRPRGEHALCTGDASQFKTMRHFSKKFCQKLQIFHAAAQRLMLNGD
jgi:hypothetical protein